MIRNTSGRGNLYEAFLATKFVFYDGVCFRDEQEIVTHSDDAFAPVAYLNFIRTHLEDKQMVCTV